MSVMYSICMTCLNLTQQVPVSAGKYNVHLRQDPKHITQQVPVAASIMST